MSKRIEKITLTPEELPPTTVIGVCNEMYVCYSLLLRVFGATVKITHTGRVLHQDHSIRMLYQAASDVPVHGLNKSMTLLQAAAELVRFSETEARYPPKPSEESAKVIQIEQFDANGHPAVLVRTIWS